MANTDRDTGTPADDSGIFGRGLDVLFGEAEDAPPPPPPPDQVDQLASSTGAVPPPPPPGEAEEPPGTEQTLAVQGTPAQASEPAGRAAPDASPTAGIPAAAGVPAAADYRPSSRRPTAISATRLTGGTATPTGDDGRRKVSLRVGGVLMDLPAEELAQLVPPGPGDQVVDEIVISPRNYTQAERERILSELDMQRREDLMKELDTLYEATSTRIASHQQHSGTALKLLHEARSILIERPYAFADAELRMQAARALVHRTEESRRVSGRHWPWLLFYQLAWALLLLAGVVMEGPLGAWIGSLTMSGAETMLEIFPAWGTMMVGGIGGVVCAIWSMWYHISDQQDYSTQHNLWYLVQPFQGMVLGLIIYLVIAAGFLAFQTDISSPDATAAAKYFPWLVAAMAGIRQTFVYELLERIVRIISPRVD